MVSLACSVPIGASGIAFATMSEKPDAAASTIQANFLFICDRPNFGSQDDSGLMCLVHPGAMAGRTVARYWLWSPGHIMARTPYASIADTRTRLAQS